jgi:hypothetical protein
MSPGTLVLVGLLSSGGSKLFSGDYLMPGLDLSPRPGIEVSYVSMDKLSWTGLVAAAAWDLNAEAMHGVLALEAGFIFFGAEGGLAVRQDGTVGARWRALLSGGPFTAYGEYLTLDDCPWSAGLLVKIPVEL